MDDFDKDFLVMLVSLMAICILAAFILIGIATIFTCDSGCQIDRRNDKLYECVNVNRMSEATCLEIVSP
jgi:hypothetical protein